MRSLAAEHSYRSALDDYPGGCPPVSPSVSIVVPTRNEIACLNRLLNDLLAQDYGNIVEFWFVDGHSHDGTYEALLRVRNMHGCVRVAENAKLGPAAGINIALRRAAGDIVMRLDAHARYAPDVVRQSVQALLRTGAGGVGAIARPAAADTLVGRAIVAAHRSPVGVGVAKFRKEGAEGWADTIWNGCYWRHVVDRVGPLREDLPRAEDNDFNARVRQQGYGLYLTPAIRAHYLPRQGLGALWRQYFANGIGVARAVRESRGAVSIRHFAPLALVVLLLSSALVGMAWPPALLLTAFMTLCYVAGLIGAALVEARRDRGTHLLLLPIVLAVLHLAYGLGSLVGFASLARPWHRSVSPRST